MSNEEYNSWPLNIAEVMMGAGAVEDQIRRMNDQLYARAGYRSQTATLAPDVWGQLVRELQTARRYFEPPADPREPFRLSNILIEQDPDSPPGMIHLLPQPRE